MNLVDAFSGIKSILTKPAIRPVFPNPVTYNKREECRTPNVTNGKCKRKVT